MSKAIAWMPTYIAEKFAETASMDATEYRAFDHIIMSMWQAGGWIADDDHELAGLARVSLAKWRTIKPRLYRRFVMKDGRIAHERTLEELGKALANVEQKRAAGIASAKARNSNGRSTGVEQPLPPRCNGTPTAGQPYAGEGEGCQSQGRLGKGEGYTHTREGLTVIPGGGK